MTRAGFPWPLLAVALTSCTTPSDVVLPADLYGVWSNAEASLELSAEGGRTRYLCGLGSVDAGWAVTAEGTFTGVGSHRFGGGPLPSSEHEPHPAEYEGRVRDEVIELTVVLPDVDVTLGPFVLTRGGPLVTETCA